MMVTRSGREIPDELFVDVLYRGLGDKLDTILVRLARIDQLLQAIAVAVSQTKDPEEFLKRLLTV